MSSTAAGNPRITIRITRQSTEPRSWLARTSPHDAVARVRMRDAVRAPLAVTDCDAVLLLERLLAALGDRESTARRRGSGRGAYY